VSKIEALLTIAGSSLTLLLGMIVLFLSKLKEIRELRSQLSGPTIVGVVGTTVPKELVAYRDFVDYKKARRCNDDIVILHCRLLSYALRKCDFVCADVYRTDEKVHKPNDQFWKALINDSKNEEK